MNDGLQFSIFKYRSTNFETPCWTWAQCRWLLKDVWTESRRAFYTQWNLHYQAPPKHRSKGPSRPNKGGS